MAIAFVAASAGATDAGGAWTYTTSAPGAAGRLIIVHVFQDGTSANTDVTITSATNVENLAGTDNVFTALASTGSDVGSAATGYQYIFFGRSLNTSAIVITGANSGTNDIYVRTYEFSGVSTGTTLATVIEQTTAGSFSAAAGTSDTVADVGVTTRGPNRLALNLTATDDDLTVGGSFTGESGGDWTSVASYGVSTGTDGALNLNTAAIASVGTIDGGTYSITSMGWGMIGFALIPASSAAITGTITASVDESDIVTGGKTSIITLTDDHWIAAGAGSFDLQRDEIIAGHDSNQSEALGWDLVPKALQSLGGVARTSDTVVTVTWDAFATYNITANETITVTVPATATVNGVAMTGSPTFTITFISTTSIKTVNGLADASVKTIDNLARASVKTWDGLV
jgi:hypothetical protein